MPGAVLTFFYTVSLLTLTQLCQAGTIIIPTPQTRKLRDTHGGFPRLHSQPVDSDPSLCPCNHYAMLLPVVPTQPLSTVTPLAKPQVPGGHSVWGHWDTLFDCNLLELLSKPWVVGVSAWSPPPKVSTPGCVIQARALNQGAEDSGGVSRKPVSSGHKHGLS